MVLMASCDARYVFPFADIGGEGSNNDSWVFRKSAIGKWFFNKEMNLPNPENMENQIWSNSLLSGWWWRIPTTAVAYETLPWSRNPRKLGYF